MVETFGPSSGTPTAYVSLSLSSDESGDDVTIPYDTVEEGPVGFTVDTNNGVFSPEETGVYAVQSQTALFRLSDVGEVEVSLREPPATIFQRTIDDFSRINNDDERAYITSVMMLELDSATDYGIVVRHTETGFFDIAGSQEKTRLNAFRIA